VRNLFLLLEIRLKTNRQASRVYRKEGGRRLAGTYPGVCFGGLNTSLDGYFLQFARGFREKIFKRPQNVYVPGLRLAGCRII